MELSLILVLKIAVTMIAVVGLSLIAEHLSTRLAGILAGFPHGIAIVLYFIGIEQGTEFAAQASIYAIGGLAANVLLAYAYFLLCRSANRGNLVLASIGSVTAFLCAATILYQLKIDQFNATVIAGGTIAVVGLLLRHVDNTHITGKTKIRLVDILLRAVLATAIVLTITQMAYLIGPNWSGLLAGFPVVTFPLLLIVHSQHGKEPVATIVKNYPFGLTSLIVFTVIVSFAYPVFGMNLGTLIGLACAIIYLAGLSFLTQKRPANN